MRDAHLDLRPAGRLDAEFLVALYETTRSGEFRLLEPAVRRRLLEMQCAAQQRAYRTRYPGSEHSIVLVDGEPAGRVWVARDSDTIRVVDVSLLPAHRERGVGTALYRRLLDEAAGGHKTIVAFVSKANAVSLRFHLQLGFTVAAEHEMDYAVEMTPDPGCGPR